jgi:hypothetical protein
MPMKRPPHNLKPALAILLSLLAVSASAISVTALRSEFLKDLKRIDATNPSVGTADEIAYTTAVLSTLPAPG